MKAFLSIVAIMAILGGLAAAANGVKWANSPAAGVTPSTTGNPMAIQVCPDQKIDNQMPGPGDPKPSYYLLNGERREISEFDAVWVAANCNVPTQTVY